MSILAAFLPVLILVAAFAVIAVVIYFYNKNNVKQNELPTDVLAEIFLDDNSANK